MSVGNGRRKKLKSTCHKNQNEMLEMIMAQNILRTIASNVQSTEFVSVVMDEYLFSEQRTGKNNNGNSNNDSTIFQTGCAYISLNTHEEFIGLYEVDSIEAST